MALIQGQNEGWERLKKESSNPGNVASYPTNTNMRGSEGNGHGPEGAGAHHQTLPIHTQGSEGSRHNHARGGNVRCAYHATGDAIDPNEMQMQHAGHQPMHAAMGRSARPMQDPYGNPNG